MGFMDGHHHRHWRSRSSVGWVGVGVGGDALARSARLLVPACNSVSALLLCICFVILYLLCDSVSAL